MPGQHPDCYLFRLGNRPGRLQKPSVGILAGSQVSPSHPNVFSAPRHPLVHQQMLRLQGSPGEAAEVGTKNHPAAWIPLGCPRRRKWMDQWFIGYMGWKFHPQGKIPILQVGENNPCIKHVLTSWDIQATPGNDHISKYPIRHELEFSMIFRLSRERWDDMWSYPFTSSNGSFLLFHCQISFRPSSEGQPWRPGRLFHSTFAFK